MAAYLGVVRNDEWGPAMTSNVGLRIGVLGPLLVIRDGTPAMLPQGRTGVLLAVLAMPAARLARTAWPG